MKSSKTVRILTLAAAAAMMLASCAAPAAPASAPAAPAATTAPAAEAAKPTEAPAAGAETMRFYSSLPLTGNSAAQTATIVKAIELAIAQNTKDGTVCEGKFKIDYVSLDDATAAKGQWDEAQEQANANKAVGDPDTMVYIGTFNSGAAKISIPILNQATPMLGMISPANTNVGLTKKFNAGEPEKYYPSGKRNYMRVVAHDGLQGSFGARWAQKLGAKKVILVDDQQAYGKGLADVFAKVAKEIKLEVMSREVIEANQGDYKTLANKIAAAKPDLVYYGGITGKGTSSFVQELRTAAPDIKIMGADGILENEFAEKTKGAEGVYATIAGVPREKLGNKGKKFFDDYKAKNGADPEAYAIYGYEAASVVIKAVSTVCKKDRLAILDAMFTTKDFDGVLGKWSFDADGDTSLDSMVGNVVKDGKWSVVAPDQLP